MPEIILPQIILDIQREIGNFISKCVEIIVFFTDWSEFAALLAFWIIVAEILIFIIFIPLHRLILRKIQSSKADLVKEIDEVIFLLAKAQIDSKISKDQLGGDPHFAMMNEMFATEHFEYLNNIDRIKSFVTKIQVILGTTIATDDQRKRVSKIQRKMKILIFFSRFIGILDCIFTLGIYRLFW
ncbi:hypothetical protein AGMMS50249_7040 [candidate division SR1 bacterium]|nr:hypothetical protein AGMMS50249_7040 [candidate division SR1 bacterium]